MSTAATKTLARRFYEEAINKHNLDAAYEFFASNFVDHNPGPDQAPGLEGVKQAFDVFFKAFPDLRVSVEEQLAEGDKVVSRITVRGTHRGEFMEIAPTGKQVTITGIDIFRFAGGKVVERWGNFDELGMMQQLGAIPTPGQQG